MAKMPAAAPGATDAILERLARLHPRLIDLSLDRILALLARLRHPERRLPPVIHVAGTNGKGSLIAFLRAALEAAGYRVHAYTSPHLVRFNERIRLAGRLIEDAPLQDVLERVERINDGRPITQFEITTAAAFVAFAETPADVLLLETGLGGEFDATNVMTAPRLVAITPVDFDHMEFLGASLAEIARAKAGILKPLRPAVIGPQRPEAMSVIEARAAVVGAPLFRHGREWRFEATQDGFDYIEPELRLAMPTPGLVGPHQFANAATAVACLRRLDGFEVAPSAVATGLRTVEWPARLQRLQQGPLVAMLDPGDELWLDGGHNPHGAIAIRDHAVARHVRFDVVLAMKSNKDLGAYVAALKPVVRRVVGIAIPDDPACHDAPAIAAVARDAGIAADAAPTPAAAIRLLLSEPAPRRILICGSLYLAGHILGEHG